MMNSEGFGRKRLWSTLDRTDISVLSGGIDEHLKEPQCFGRISNLVSPEYESRILTAQPHYFEIC
jgi:hypothetical protein